MIIDIPLFGGMAPAIAQHLLPNDGAHVAENVRIGSGEVRPLKLMLPVRNVGFSAQSIYYFNGGWWLYTDKGRRFVPSPSSVTPQRLYMTKLAGGARILANDVEYDLGVLEPEQKPAGASSGGTGAEQVRVYVYTCVSILGEEGPPSPPSDEITSNETGATVDLTDILTPDESGTDHPPIEKKRIYRAAVGASGNVEYMYVDEVSAAQTTYSDTKDDGELGETLPSLGWRKPPGDLQGLTNLPGGVVAGFSGRSIRLSEPWQFHAWSDAYAHEIDYEIVSMAASGRTLYILTTGPVYQMTVNDPASAVPERLPGTLPCVDGNAAWETPYGVVFASVDGLYVAAPGLSVPQRLTAGLYDEETWGEFQFDSFFGEWHAGQLYIGFQTNTLKRGLLIVSNVAAESPVLTVSDIIADAITANPNDGGLYVSSGGMVYKWEGNRLLTMTGRWRSKEFVTPEPTNFAVAIVEADYLSLASDEDLQSDITAAFSVTVEQYDGVRGGLGVDTVGTYPFASDAFGLIIPLYNPESRNDTSVVFRLFGDGEVRYETVVQSDRLFVLPPGYQARRWFIEVESMKTVKRVGVAESAGEIYV